MVLVENRVIFSRRDPLRETKCDGPNLNGRQQRQWEAPRDEVEKRSPRAAVTDERARPNQEEDDECQAEDFYA